MNKKNETGRQDKLPLAQRLLRSLDIPLGTFGRISFIEATGNREVNIEGCIGLADYTGERVSLELCDGFVTIRGRGLELCSFSDGRMSVSGMITSINYGRECEGDA